MMTFSRFLTPELHNPFTPLAPSPSTIWYEFDISSTKEKLKFNNGERNEDRENYKQKSKRKTINTWVYIYIY